MHGPPKRKPRSFGGARGFQDNEFDSDISTRHDQIKTALKRVIIDAFSFGRLSQSRAIYLIRTHGLVAA
jgi:hypothetical protein